MEHLNISWLVRRISYVASTYVRDSSENPFDANVYSSRVAFVLPFIYYVCVRLYLIIYSLDSKLFNFCLHSAVCLLYNIILSIFTATVNR